MAITAILAMTAEEIDVASCLPKGFAYLGCHFSSAGSGLEGLPSSLSQGNGLIIDDRIPPTRLNIPMVIQQLRSINPSYMIIDFQHPPSEYTKSLAAKFAALPCPVILPPDYGKDLNCPVFLPPIPPHIPAEEYLRPWQDREIWLELALNATEIAVTASGSAVRSFLHAEPAGNAHADSRLHCHYTISQGEDCLKFYCYRTKEDLVSLVHSALPENVTHALGLFQELAGSI